MDRFILSEDIKIFCVKADSFPNGVMAAHNKLHALAPAVNGRRFFGISRPEGGREIIYKAAAEELQEGEGAKLGCETIVLKKGEYLSITIPDFMKDVSRIGKAFQQILMQPGLDPNGYCVEWYLNDTDVQCMVRLEDATS